MNNNNFNSNTFTWALNEQLGDSAINTKQQGEPFGLSDADLFHFLLGEEAQQAALPDIKSTASLSMDEDYSSEDGPREEKKQTPAVTSTTSRLDFRPINDFIPESQLKAMTSKERRQLRNKISARNFRNRRKEYIGTLEDELNEQKAENSQLKLELKWTKAKMETLEKENDKLRLDLMLGGIVLTTPQIQTSPYTIESSALINSTLNSSSSDESNLSSPPNLFSDFPDNWDFILPQSQQDTYLAHATVPDWNIDQVLSKETSVVPSNQLLFQQYPLLAPALMSIVLTHTMTLSTDEILATSKLNPPSNTIQYNNNKSLGVMTNKEAQAVWDILEPLTLLNERNDKITATADAVEEVKVEKTNLCEAYKALVLPFCPVSWLQQRVCRYLCEYIAKCTTVAPPPPSEESSVVQKPRLCRHFQRAKRYITACQ